MQTLFLLLSQYSLSSLSSECERTATTRRGTSLFHGFRIKCTRRPDFWEPEGMTFSASLTEFSRVSFIWKWQNSHSTAKRHFFHGFERQHWKASLFLLLSLCSLAPLSCDCERTHVDISRCPQLSQDIVPLCTLDTFCLPLKNARLLLCFFIFCLISCSTVWTILMFFSKYLLFSTTKVFFYHNVHLACATHLRFWIFVCQTNIFHVCTIRALTWKWNTLRFTWSFLANIQNIRIPAEQSQYFWTSPTVRLATCIKCQAKHATLSFSERNNVTCKTNHFTSFHLSGATKH